MTMAQKRHKKRGRPPLTDTENRNKVYQPLDPTSFLAETMKEVWELQGKDQNPYESNLFKSAQKYSFSLTPGNPNKGVEDMALYEYHRMTYREKGLMSIDEVMALYLRDLSRKAKVKSFKMILKFLVLFHECLNQIGWEQKVYSDSLSFFTDFERGINDDYFNRNETELQINPEIQHVREISKDLDYCEINNAEHVPLVVNRFIMEF